MISQGQRSRSQEQNYEKHPWVLSLPNETNFLCPPLHPKGGHIVITSGVVRPSVGVRHTFKWDKVFPLSPYPILTKLGGNLPGQVPQIKFEDKLERSKVKVTEVKLGKSHFGPFDPFKVHRFQRNWVWTSSATFVKLYYTGFDLRSKVKVTEVK